VDDLDTVLRSIGFRAENGIAREFGIRGYQRCGCRPRPLLCGHSKEPLRECGVRIRSGWNHGEVVRIAEHVVDTEPYQPDKKALPLPYERHRRQQGVGAVTTHDEIDLVFVDQPLVDAGNECSVRTIVLADELDRAPAQFAAARPSPTHQFCPGIC
jgi:hypothetical protein